MGKSDIGCQTVLMSWRRGLCVFHLILTLPQGFGQYENLSVCCNNEFVTRRREGWDGSERVFEFCDFKFWCAFLEINLIWLLEVPFFSLKKNYIRYVPM